MFEVFSSKYEQICTVTLIKLLPDIWKFRAYISANSAYLGSDFGGFFESSLCNLYFKAHINIFL